MKRSYGLLNKWFHLLFFIVLFSPFSSQAMTAAAGESSSGAGMGERMTRLVIQLAVIICVAKVVGFVCENYLRIPEVLGELATGMVIGPYALGGWLNLFSVPAGNGFPVSPELYGIATIASIVLLYLAGLETDLSMLIRYSFSGIMVGIGGVVVSFSLGMFGAVWFGFAQELTSPAALFLGVISTATSVGITVRILGRRNKLHSPEGVTILTAAIIDDVIGVILLAVVIGMARLSSDGGNVDWWPISKVAIKALSFWIVFTGLGLLLARRIGKFLEFFQSRETMAALSFGLSLLLAGLSEKAGLALVIGAYVMGLSLSRADCAGELRSRLEPIYHTFVSVFFCVLGMMFNFADFRSVLISGLLFSFLALAAKVLGCGLPSLLVGFNPRGALRIGSGMAPRGEVTMIMAGIGLSMNLISQEVFGVAVMMTLLCTLVAPMLLVRFFGSDASGLRRETKEEKAVQPLSLKLPNQEIADFVFSRILEMFEQEECYVHQLATGEPIFHIRKDQITITAKREDEKVLLVCADKDREYARLMLLEALADLSKIFEALRGMESMNSLRFRLSI